MTQDTLLVTSAAVSDKGLSDKRPQNEDSYLELRESGLFAVADGVGGAQAGDVASQMAMEILGEAFVNLRDDGDAEERMQLAIQQANGAIYQMSSELSQLSTMATTIVSLHISENIATIGHVGDSRLYRLDEQGNLYRETQDHSVVEEEVRAGRMTPEQAKTHPSRNVISRALGAEQTVEIDMKTIMFEPNTRFLVCSDGVTRHISDEELRSLLADEEDPFIISQTIKSICFDRGAEDNLTAVVVFVDRAPEVKTPLGGEPVNDLEEETVASVKPSLVNTAVIGNSAPNIAEKAAEKVPVPETPEISGATPEFELDEMISEEEIVIPTKKDLPDEGLVTDPGSGNRPPRGRKPEAERDVKSYRVDESGGIGVIGRIISGILWLLIGAVIGVLGYHFWTKNTPSLIPASQPVVTTSAKITAFEERRRDVDGDPEKYIADNVNPESAFDHYLLGRANILVGNFDSAKKELVKAEEKLVKTGDVNQKVLENDISIAMGKIDSGDNKKEVENSSNSNSPQRPEPEKEDESSAGN